MSLAGKLHVFQLNENYDNSALNTVFFAQAIFVKLTFQFSV